MGKGGIDWDGWSLGLGDHEAFPAVLITQFVQRDPRPLALITWPAKERTIVQAVGTAAHTGIDMVDLEIRRMAKLLATTPADVAVIFQHLGCGTDEIRLLLIIRPLGTGILRARWDLL